MYAAQQILKAYFVKNMRLSESEAETRAIEITAKLTSENLDLVNLKRDSNGNIVGYHRAYNAFMDAEYQEAHAYAYLEE